jgi:hypothetical protein
MMADIYKRLVQLETKERDNRGKLASVTNLEARVLSLEERSMRNAMDKSGSTDALGV